MDKPTLSPTEMIHQWEEGWECPACHLHRGPDGHDPCLGHLPGIKFACCGHGGKGPYLYFENGVRLSIKITEVSYDDGRSKIHPYAKSNAY